MTLTSSIKCSALYSITQAYKKKYPVLGWRSSYSYVFWVAEYESDIKIEPFGKKFQSRI